MCKYATKKKFNFVYIMFNSSASISKSSLHSLSKQSKGWEPILTFIIKIPNLNPGEIISHAIMHFYKTRRHIVFILEEKVIKMFHTIKRMMIKK